jgi:gas vesicle protein
MAEHDMIRKKVQPDLELTIEMVAGDLIIEGDSDDELKVAGEDPTVEVEEDGRSATITCENDCSVRTPESGSLKIVEAHADVRINRISGEVEIEHVGADLRIREVGGAVKVDSVGADARLNDVSGAVEIENVGSDLVARDISGAVNVASVGSDLEIKRVSGAVEVESVGSDATFREISGGLKVGSIGSDAVLHDVQGEFEIESVGSDLILDTAFVPGSQNSVGNVGSDVSVKVAPQTAVRFTIPAHIEKSINVPGTRVEGDGDTDTIIVGDAGENAAVVEFENIGSEFNLVSRGREGFSASFEFEVPDNLGEYISSQINEQISRIQDHLSHQTERIQQEAERAQQRAEELAQRAREQAERAAERAAEQAERIREKAARKGARGRWSWSGEISTPPKPPAPPAPPRPPKPVEPVTEQERLAILRMVENKQISIEEAERLLAALEGRS